MSKQNWPAHGDDGVAITATSTSAAHLIADNSLERTGEDIMVYNPGPNFVHIKTGASAEGLVATPLSIPVPPQTLSPYRKGVGATHMAVICPSGSQAIVVFTGEGA
jgi:hypothetical protein